MDTIGTTTFSAIALLMNITPSELAQIVAQASSLSERLNQPSEAAYTESASEPKINHPLLNRWCQVVAQGNWEKFQKRLMWDDLTLAQVRLALESPPITDHQTLPTWADLLREIIETTSSFANNQTTHNSHRLHPEKPLLFAEILLPAVAVARQKLLIRLGSNSLSPDCLPLELLSESAYHSLEYSLLQKLVNLSSKTLEQEFYRSRPFGQNILTLLTKLTTDKTEAKAQYDTFIQNILQDGLLSFFKTYPVLGRLIATAIYFWVESTVLFLQRLKTDLPEINRIFYPNSETASHHPSPVIAIEPSLSDPHNKGVCVMALTFESGLKLIYKPKSLGIEVAYTQFLTWCNQQNLPLPFKVLKICDRTSHGWVEYVEPTPCQDKAAAKRFYQRAGMLLCLLYALRVVDCHRENLIADGEHFVLVDMETLMHHDPKPIADFQEATDAENSVNQQFENSVLRTGLLPHWDFSKTQRLAYDISALGSFVPQLSSGTEEQDNKGEPSTPPSPIPKNVPTLNGTPLSTNDYWQEIVSGFEQMYRFLIERREILLADHSPLAALQTQRVRFIFRATRIYWTILQKSFTPKVLQNGVERSIELDILSRAFLVAPEKPNAWPILKAELQAIEQLDIPYFAAYPNSSDLTIGLPEPIERYFEQSSYKEVQTQLQNLNEIDLVQQIEIIKGSIYARVVRNPITSQGELNDVSLSLPADYSQITPLTHNQLQQEATRIANEIQGRTLWGTDGSVKWISFSYIPLAERFQLMPLSEDLYSGTSGIALFLSALDYVSNTNQFRDLVLGALYPIRKFLQTSDLESTRRFVRRGIGGATGLSSIIYSLVIISQFLKDASLLEDALGVAHLITLELIVADRQFDTIGGAAGAILGLLALYAKTKESAVLEKAIACGQHLLTHQSDAALAARKAFSPPVSPQKSGKAWRILGQQQYTGLSHGAAGIAYALLQLYAVTQDQAYLEAAREGIAYERSVFSPSAANWPDLRYLQPNGQPGFMVSWCHGAAGIGLARLGSLSVLATDEVSQDIEVALQTTQNYSLQEVDSLCCGNFGRIEVLLVAAEKLSRPDLEEVAQKKAAWAVCRAELSGGYRFPNLPNAVFSPSFFQGTAGIGYQLLRLAYPRALPSILLWDV